MFTRLANLMQMRRSTAFLLAREDDRLLDDIGLSRADLQAMRLGLDGALLRTRTAAFPSGGALPSRVRA